MDKQATESAIGGEMAATPERWAWIPTAREAPGLFDDRTGAALTETVRASGVNTFLWTFEEATLPAVRGMRRALRVSVCPVVPNMATYARDTRDKGFVGAALARFFRLGVGAQAKVVAGAIPAARDVLAKDFATGVTILAEMEMARCLKLGPTTAFLNSQMVDLAMAFDNARLFERFERVTRDRYGLRAGLVTNNFGHLAGRLEAWGRRPDAIATPLNAKGYLMYPDREACEAAAARWAEALIALEPAPGAETTNDGADDAAKGGRDGGAARRARDYVASLGVRRIVEPLIPAE